MNEPVIKVDNLGKKYIINHNVEGGAITGGFPTLRDRIVGTINRLKNRALSSFSGKEFIPPATEEFWALKGVSFEIREGDRIGIIGRNGAGKSTLLKLLSRITVPTTGEIILNGRVASLLEVGTGFHPELTGRENIYLNGAILGMSRAEIKRKFDEIVAFAEVEKFLDTPVKRYSSGMYVRLAFAVSAHLEPEILIVDEVLAVGDAAFQKKCLEKLEDAGKEGRTILFVSHDLKSISGLCSRVMLLEQGALIKQGRPSEVISMYNKMLGSRNGEIFRIAGGKITWKGILNRQELDNLSHNDDLKFIFDFESNEKIINFHLDCAIYNEKDECVIHSRSKFICEGFSAEKNERFRLDYLIKKPNLAPGSYHMTIYLYAEQDGFEELLWIDKIHACFVSSSTGFSNTYYLEQVMSATVPKFEMSLSKKSKLLSDL